MVKSLSQVATKLEVLSLVFPNRYKIGIIEKDVSSHKDGIA